MSGCSGRLNRQSGNRGRLRSSVGYRVGRTGCADDPHCAGRSTEGTRGAVRTAIVSTYPPRACGIGTFAADVRSALLGVDGVDRVEKVVIVNEPSRPQRPGLVADDRAGSSRRLRPRRADSRPAGCRRRPPPARVRDLRRRRRRVRALARGGALAAARRHAPHRAVGADEASGRGARCALPPGRARDRDDRDGQAAARRTAARARPTRFASFRTAHRRCSRSAQTPTRWSARPETAPRCAPRTAAASTSCSRRSG